MKFTYVNVSILIFALVLVSGCTGIPDVFGRDVISVQQNTVQNGVRDIVTLNDIITIPKSPLLPDQQVVFSFIAANNDKLKNTNVVVDLFNAPTMRDVTGSNPCNLYIGQPTCSINLGQCVSPTGTTTQGPYCLPDQCGVDSTSTDSNGVVRSGCMILPGEQKQINFQLRTPGQAEIANIKTDTKLDFKVTYDFDGTLTYLIPAISTDEIIKRQRSGDKTTLFTSKSYSSGPVQVDVTIQGAPYMLSDTSGRPTDTVLLFTVKNIGSGNIVNSQIKSNDMTILFPPEFEVDPQKYSDKFICTAASGGTLCANSATGSGGEDIGKIELYKDESRSSLYFTVRLQQPLQEPFRTFQIISNIKYSYELRDSVSLTINPFQNV